jgi:hypothetical protein
MEEKFSIYFILLLTSALRNNKKKETLQCSRGLLAHRGIDTTSGKVSSFVRIIVKRVPRFYFLCTKSTCCRMYTNVEINYIQLAYFFQFSKVLKRLTDINRKRSSCESELVSIKVLKDFLYYSLIS